MPRKSNLDVISQDTIAAIATPPGVGAIGIVRLSGPQAIRIASECFRSRRQTLEQLPNYRLAYGEWIDPERVETIDEVLVGVMRAPSSYTREDVVEIYGHGGPLVLRQVLAAALTAGARPAEPGEFTLRAFRAGRIDLLQAEAVADLIEAQTESARRLAMRALRGGLSERVGQMKEQVLELLAHLETHLEFPMEAVEPMAPEELLAKAGVIRKEVKDLLEMARRREMYRRGLVTVMTGRPNVGKSLLFNRVLGRQRALVTEVPGTTRDTLEETIRLGGVELLLVDTAGGRDVEHAVEKLGVKRTADAAAQADLIWFMIDAAEAVTPEDEKWLKKILDATRPESCLLMLVLNKSDLMVKPPEIGSEIFQKTFPKRKRFTLSAKTGEGVERFLAEVERACLEQCPLAVESDLLLNKRHERALEEMLSAFERIEQATKGGLSLDCVAMDLWEVKSGLDRLDGVKASDDLLGEIFSRFCIGK